MRVVEAQAMRQGRKVVFTIFGMAAGFVACGGTTRIEVSDAGTGGAAAAGSSSGGGSSTGGTSATGGTTASGGTTHASGGTAGNGGTTAYDACKAASDCAWGEIDHEILSAKDCPCVYGCPGLAQSSATVQRRLSQYNKLCDPRHDGMGNVCGIDDCIVPPALTCVDGQCEGPRAL